MIRIRNITRSYGRKQVLRGIDLEAAQGQCIGILGMNGSGKSTLLQVLAGVISADSGEFTYEGEDLLGNEPLRRSLVGYVPQGTPLIEELSARDNLRLWYGREAMERSLEEGPLRILGIGGFLRVPVRKMSGGMKKRLSVGCAVAGEPRILLLDEPGSSLDLICKEAIDRYFRTFLSGGGIILLVTHDVQELALCHSARILKGGVLVPYTFDGDTHRLALALEAPDAV